MTAPTPPAVPAQEPTTPATSPAQDPTPAATVAPPWGDPANFDPDKAWKLIEDLRADKEKLAARTAMTDEQKQQLAEYQRLVDASKSEAQRQAEAVANATREAETARAEAVRYRVAATHGIPADHFDLLGSGTEEEIAARAEKISTLLAAQAAAAATTPPVGAPPARPVEQLRPGATPAGVQSEDDVIFASLFGPPK